MDANELEQLRLVLGDELVSRDGKHYIRDIELYKHMGYNIGELERVANFGEFLQKVAKL
jgi:hypothetical protein